MPIAQRVTFLNVDLMVLGDFDRKPLLRALGKSVIALHDLDDDVRLDGDPCLVLEVADTGLDVAGTLGRFVELIERLPPTARKTWRAAKRRRFDVGVQGGRHPHTTSWLVSKELLAAVADCGAELAITVYGA